MQIIVSDSAFGGSPNEETYYRASLISVNGTPFAQLLETRWLGIILDVSLSLSDHNLVRPSLL